MNPAAMGLVIGGLVGLFLWSARRRWALLEVGTTTWESRLSNLVARARAVWTYAFFQKKMRYYLWAGLAHQLIFLGFGVLLLRTIVLWGRGFDPAFNLWVLGSDSPLGLVYGFLKDFFALAVITGVTVFVYYRVVRPQKRMTLSGEGLLILGIILTMMVSDLTYDGASIVLNHRYAEMCGSSASTALCEKARELIAPLGPPQGELGFHIAEPGGTTFALWVYVDVDAPIKYAVLKLRNLSGRVRRISVIGDVEWVLGDVRTKSLMHVVTEQDALRLLANFVK